MNNAIAVILIFVFPLTGFSQNLDDFFSSTETTNNSYVNTTFLGERIGSGQSIEIPAKGELNMIISHRFGRIDGGLYEFFGLDIATMRMGFDYGFTDRFAAGIGRSSYQKIYDVYLKYLPVKQKQNGSPISIGVYSSFNYISLKNFFPEDHDSFIDHSGMSILLIMARKFGESVGFQISPAWHRNTFALEVGKKTDTYAMGTGIRFKLTNMVHLTGEYYHILSTPYTETYSPLTLGFDLETGGHLFQLVFSNSQGMTEKTYFSDTRSSWKKGEVYFGFNLIRVFYLK